MEYSIAAGVTGSVFIGTGVLNANPVLENPRGADQVFGTADADYGLASGSPAIDSGANDLVGTDVADVDGDGDFSESLGVDLLGNHRIVDGGSGSARVDMGAIEFASFQVGRDDLDRTAQCPATPDVGRCVLSIFPNPAREVLRVNTGSLQRPGEIRVIDVSGRLLFRTLIHSVDRVIEVDVSQLPSAVYFVVLSDEHGNVAAASLAVVR